MQVYFTLVKKLSKYTWSIQKYRLNEASSVGQSFADACDEGMVSTFPSLLVIGEVVSLCCLCGKTFTSQSLLHKHFELMHEGTEIDTEQYDLSGFTGVSGTPTSSGTMDDSRKFSRNQSCRQPSLSIVHSPFSPEFFNVCLLCIHVLLRSRVNQEVVLIRNLRLKLLV
ncbi:hypothetical protein P879_06736 [Paragonimus westermani]|uniref:C2H2-type domain-containing protein n=1 Tax=Paragonimus westermani TaxID=34504 RepID=A0A8T0DMY6_9TREM|nr:hypothetical protein P879_06736 [Paragonimus westermani]